MNRLGFNVTDVRDPHKLEKFLVRVTRDLEALRAEYEAQVTALKKELASATSSLSSAQTRLSAVEGAYSTMYRTSPADVLTYDETTNQWISTSGTSTTFAGDLIPSLDDTYDIGSSTLEWQDIYIDGTAYVDALNVDAVTLTGDIIGAATSAIYLGASATDGTWKIVRSGTDLQILRREAGVYNLKATVIA